MKYSFENKGRVKVRLNVKYLYEIIKVIMSKDDRRISDDRIKEKCFRYFRGESTYEDEVSIRESLSDGKLSTDDFRTMEKDWCDSERPTAGQRMAYARFKQRQRRLLVENNAVIASLLTHKSCPRKL